MAEITSHVSNLSQLLSQAYESLAGDTPRPSEQSKLWREDGLPTELGEIVQLQDFVMELCPVTLAGAGSIELVEQLNNLRGQLEEIETMCNSDHAQGTPCFFEDIIRSVCRQTAAPSAGINDPPAQMTPAEVLGETIIAFHGYKKSHQHTTGPGPSEGELDPSIDGRRVPGGWPTRS
jgi:hypothetical protein